MSHPDGTGSEREREPDEDIVLPSWIDAAISRTREQGEPLESYQAEPLPEHAVEPMADEPVPDDAPTEEYRLEEEYPRQVVPFEQPSSEPFPSFLDRRDSMAYETERIVDIPADAIESAEPAAEESLWPPPATEPMNEAQPALSQPAADQLPENFLRRRVAEQFEAQRAASVTEAMGEDPSMGSDQIPVPDVPPRHRAPSGPWLMAALFFTAAALVLAVLIWLRPLPQ